jgi:hypothetical protein
MSTCAPPHTADSLLNTISTNTNAYAQKKIKEQENSGARVWVEVKPQEIGAWIGIVLYMGVHRSPAIRAVNRASSPSLRQDYPGLIIIVLEN